MEWISVDKKPPEDDVLYAICVYNNIYGKSVPQDAFGTLRDGKWYWWVDGVADEIEGKVTYYMELEFPKEESK